MLQAGFLNSTVARPCQWSCF